MSNFVGKSGIDWNYNVEGEGEVLLFIHGWGVDSRIWRQQTKYFTQHYKVITLDLPGHGQSTFKKVMLETKAHDLDMLLDFLNVTSLTIVGSSLGGLLALKYYEFYPKRIKRLVFVGSMPKFSKSPDYPYGIDVARIRKLNSQLNSDYPTIVNVFFRSLFTKEERQTRRYQWLQRFKRTAEVPMQQALVEYLDILETEDLRHVLKRAAIPMQFINGTGDSICHNQAVAYLKEVAPLSRFDDFAQCGHFPFLSKAYEFNDILHDFLKTT